MLVERYKAASWARQTATTGFARGACLFESDMDRATCKKLAEIIKNEDILEMFKTAKANIKDWTVASRLNPAMSKGVAWNILASRFDVNEEHHDIVIRNMLMEFGEWLTIKPYMECCLPKPKVKQLVECHHQEPNFENY